LLTTKMQGLCASAVDSHTCLATLLLRCGASRNNSTTAARRLLRRALSEASLAAVPEKPGELALFVCGTLRDLAERSQGTAEADALTEALEPLFERAPDARASGVRRQTPRLVTCRTLLLSTDAAQGEALAGAIAGVGELTTAPDTFTLLAELDAHRGRPLVIVVGRGPGLGGPMLETLARTAPKDTELVFWGGAPEDPIELPVARLAEDASAQEVAAYCVKAPAPLAEPPRVVIADDDPTWRSVLERALRGAGYAVTACADGVAALDACVDARPGLLITDLDMPALSGQQLAALVTSRFSDDPPPVLVMTASPVDAPPAHVAEVLTKGQRLAEVVDRVRAHLPLPDAPLPDAPVPDGE